MGLRTIGALLLGISLLSGCDDAPAGSETADARIRTLASFVGAQTIGFVSVNPDTVSMQFIAFDGSPRFASMDVLGRITLNRAPTFAEVAFLTRPVPLDQLQLDLFTARIAALPGCRNVHANLFATHGGSILQEIGCPVDDGFLPPVIHQTFLDANPVEHLPLLTEATLATALLEARQLVGPQAVRLEFDASVGRAPTSFGFRVISEPLVSLLDGSPCHVVTQRSGVLAVGIRPVLHRGCVAVTVPDPFTRLSLENVHPAAFLVALTRGADSLGVPVEQVQHFELIQDASLQLQVRVSIDMLSDLPRSVVVPLD